MRSWGYDPACVVTSHRIALIAKLGDHDVDAEILDIGNHSPLRITALPTIAIVRTAHVVSNSHESGRIRLQYSIL